MAYGAFAELRFPKMGPEVSNVSFEGRKASFDLPSTFDPHFWYFIGYIA